jgi:hypothetical protein
MDIGIEIYWGHGFGGDRVALTRPGGGGVRGGDNSPYVNWVTVYVIKL